MANKNSKKDEDLGGEGELSEDRGPAKGEAYGIAAVTMALKGIEFPCNKRQLLEKVGKGKNIPWTKDNVIDLRQVIEEMPEDRFESITELTQKISESVHASTEK